MSETDQKETLGFQAEVKQLLHLVTHSLYSNKEIFLRELISNASDASDKLRFAALSDNELYESESELKITIDVDPDLKTITITDNGIGMDRQEVIDNLGTIAKSGTREFISALSGDQAKDSNMIGQFGVGFYSAFIVADKVTVRTRRAGKAVNEGVLWESSGEGEFIIENIDKENRGTQITLHVGEDSTEFLEEWKLRSIITKYSDHISFPVLMKKQEMPTPEVDDAEKPDEAEDAQIIEDVVEYEPVNRAKALWTMGKNEITEEEYKEFYKHISHDFQDPAHWAHNKVEGKLEYTSLLYIPSHAPFDLWNRDTPRGLKLYVKRVFIMDNAEELLPLYLRFVKGVIDSNDLPLNVSREILQNNRVIESIKSATAKRVLSTLERLAKDDKDIYQEFWKNFGAVLKEGPAEDHSNREQIGKLLRFATTHDDAESQTHSLEDYIGRMKEGQDAIYYITAESFAAAKNSPHLEIFRKKGVEVLLLTDRVDEWLVTHLSEFDGKTLKSVAKGGLDLGELEDEKEKEEHKQVETAFEDYVKRMTETLGEKVKEVRVTHRLTQSPACIVADENDMSGNIQRMLQAAGQDIPVTKPILELNPEHPLVLRHKEEQNAEQFQQWSNLLLEQAILAEGGQLEDPAEFVARLNKMLLDITQ